MYNISRNKKLYKTPVIKVKEINYGRVMETIIGVSNKVDDVEGGAKQSTTTFNSFSFEDEDNTLHYVGE